MNKFSIFKLAAVVSCLLAATNFVYSQGSTPANGEAYTDKIDFPSLSLNICESNGRKYKIKVDGDRARIKADPGEDFGGTALCFDESLHKSLSAYVEYEFGVRQHFYDAQPSKVLSFKIETVIGEITIEDSLILNPQTGSELDGVNTIYDQLGFESRADFESVFESSNFSTFAELSYSTQKAFYADKLKNDRKRLEECCPDFISQAEAFLKRNRAEFREMKDLNLELVRTKTVITLIGETKEGVKFKYFIEDKLAD